MSHHKTRQFIVKTEIETSIRLRFDVIHSRFSFLYTMNWAWEREKICGGVETVMYCLIKKLRVMDKTGGDIGTIYLKFSIILSIGQGWICPKNQLFCVNT